MWYRIPIFFLFPFFACFFSFTALFWIFLKFLFICNYYYCFFSTLVCPLRLLIDIFFPSRIQVWSQRSRIGENLSDTQRTILQFMCPFCQRSRSSSKHVCVDGKFPEGHRVTCVCRTRVSLLFLQFSRCLPKHMNYCLTKLTQIIQKKSRWNIPFKMHFFSQIASLGIILQNICLISCDSIIWRKHLGIVTVFCIIKLTWPPNILFKDVIILPCRGMNYSSEELRWAGSRQVSSHAGE